MNVEFWAWSKLDKFVGEFVENFSWEVCVISTMSQSVSSTFVKISGRNTILLCENYSDCTLISCSVKLMKLILFS